MSYTRDECVCAHMQVFGLQSAQREGESRVADTYQYYTVAMYGHF